MARLVHYYHLYANGNWLEPWEDQIKALVDSGLYQKLDSIKIGVVGGSGQRKAAIEAVTLHDKVQIVVEASTGYEQETLDILYQESMESEEEIYFLYGHTKGAAFHRPINAWWRRDMIRHTVERWQESISLLNEGYDATGIYWRRGPLGSKSPVANSHFSGNFWWAKSSYLNTLGVPARNSRYDAEAWIGLNPNIKAYELHGGMPKVGRGSPRPQKPPRPGEYSSYLVVSKVLGPYGKLTPGRVVSLPNTVYVQTMVKSGAIQLWS